MSLIIHRTEDVKEVWVDYTLTNTYTSDGSHPYGSSHGVAHYLSSIVLSPVESVCAGVCMHLYVALVNVAFFSLYLSVSLTLPPLC